MGNSGKNIALHTLWQDYLQGTLVNTINEIAGAVVEFSALVFGLLKWLKNRGDFNIHGTKYFLDAVFHQKSKIYDVVSLLYVWWVKKPVLSMKC